MIKMEISEREYFELKEQVLQLQNKLDAIPKPAKYLRDRVAEVPISSVRNVVDDEPIFDYRYMSNDAWTLFVKLSKMIHEPSDRFYMGTSSTYPTYGRPYIRSYKNGKAPAKIAEMTEEQVSISIDMLNELIPIYNKYFRLTHQTVLYDPTGDGKYEMVMVCSVD